MSAFNWFTTEAKALDLRTKLLTTSTTNTTYDARTGRATDNFVFDRIIRVNTTSESSMTITLPDGIAYGQKILVIMETLGGSAKVDVASDRGDSATQMSAAGAYSDLVYMGDTIGWVELSNETT